jgi:hypothetical protein
MTFQSIVNQMKEEPKKLFLIDGFGALISAFLLGVVLVQFESTFGMPRKELYILSLLAVGFAIYSFTCSWKLPPNWQVYLKTIAVVNSLYCCLTLGLMFYHGETITTLGVV